MTVAPATSRHAYSKAPIVEAVIDLRASFVDPAIALDKATALAEELASAFPQRQPINVVTLGAEQKDGGLLVPQPPRHEQIGWKLIGTNNDRVLQIGKNGFTYSHLPPYTQWETFRAEAQPLWERYVRMCVPDVVTRIGVRYINRLKLPPGALNLADYLLVYPQVPDAIPLVSRLLMQLQMPQPDVKGTSLATVTLASEESRETAWQPIVLDLELFTELLAGFNQSELWDILELLRNKKNELFEACLTTRMKELIA